MEKELLLEVPARLEATAAGGLAGPVRLANHLFSEWRCTCHLEAQAGPRAEIAFAPDGTAELKLPRHVSGTLLAVLELAEPYGGARLTGAFQLTVEPGAGKSLRRVVYQPLTASGSAAADGALVGDKVLLRIPLAAERASRAVPLGELLARERCLPLPDHSDGSARVVTIHAGESTVVGRCYASQLRRETRGFLDRLGESAIHWVTLWDDRWVNKLTARLRYRLEAGKQSLEVRNITDYSQASNELRVVLSTHGEHRLKPGRAIAFPLAPQAVLKILVGEGEHQREVVSCRFTEARLGKLRVRIPVLQTERTEFRFPPEDPAGLRMRYMGIWLPLPRERLEHLMGLAEEPLTIAFPREAIYFWIRYRHARELLTVSSNEDIKECLAAT